MPAGMFENSPPPPPVSGTLSHLEVEEAVALVRSSGLMVTAGLLVSSLGPKGRRVTPSSALAPAEVPEAAGVLGLQVKPPVRRAADVPQVHQGWLMAIGAGMVRIASGRGLRVDDHAADGVGGGGGAVVDTGDVDVDEQVLTGWLEGFRLICADASGRRYPQTLQWLVLLVLEALGDPLWPQLCRQCGGHDYALQTGVQRALYEDNGLRQLVDEQKLYTWLAPPFPRDGDWRLFALLVDAGAVQGTASQPELTAAGRWLAGRLRERAPVRIRPDWPASVVLEHLKTADTDADLWSLAAAWRRARNPVDAARQLLGAAAATDAATRGAAVRLVTSFGEQALPAWREVVASDDLGPQARRIMSWWEEGPGPRDEDQWWLGVEWAAAVLPGSGPDEALSFLADAAGLRRGDRPDAQELVAAVSGCNHPQAEQVTAALTEFLESGAPRSVEHQLQVTVRLNHWRPATWRRVLIPATGSLGTLAWTIAVLFGWGSDHLHIFEIGPRKFTDPLYPLEDVDDEDDARLSRLFAAGVRTFSYTYDLGACWEHEITLERLVPIEPGQPTLRCVAFAGDSPREYPLLEDEDGNEITNPVVTKPFQLDKANETLASGHYVVADYDDDDEDDDDEAWPKDG